MAEQQKSVKLNVIMNFILTLSNFIFPLITFPYISRILQASGIGTVTFVTSTVNYFAMLAMLGIPTYGIRACAKVRDNRELLSKTVQEILLINFMTTLVTMLTLVVSVLSIPRFYQEKELYLILSTSLIFNMLGVDWLYRALEKYSYITIRSIIFKFVSVLLLLFFVKDRQDYVVYGAITVFAAVGSNVMNMLNLNKMVDLRPAGQLSLTPHLKPIMTFFLLTVSTTIYLNVDTTMLGFIKGDEAVGYYSAAVKIKQILVSIVTSLGAVLLPRLSFYYERGNDIEFKRLTQKALNFIIILSLPLVIYFILLAEESILFLSGSTFLSAVLPMQLIMPTVLFIGLSNLMGIQILVPSNREKLVVYSTVVGAVVDMAINAFAIPLWGASGAAFAGSMAELAVTAIQFYILRSFLRPLLKEIQFFKIGLALISATIVVMIVMTSIDASVFIRLLLTATLFFLSYGSLLYALKEKFVMDFSSSLILKLRKAQHIDV